MKTTYPAFIQNILDGITDRVEARKKLYVPRTNMNDDSMNMNWYEDSKQLVVNKYIDGTNSRQITCTEGEGVYYQKKVNGTWTTVPTGVSRGGTGVTGLVTKDFTFNGITFRAWKWGPVVMISALSGKATNAMSASVSIGTLTAGYRPQVLVSVLDTSTSEQERWMIDSSGHVQPTLAVAAGTSVRFTVTYLVEG